MATSCTTYSSAWNAGKTKVIRVPAALADEIITYARYLDAKVPAPEVAEAGYSLEAWGDCSPNSATPVNVASVPMRSPFRYPSGKTWLVPYLRSWLNSRPVPPALFVEPFAGGGICSLTVAFESLCQHVLMAELDPQVAAVWKTILRGHADWLAERILEYDLDESAARRDLARSESPELTTRDRAFFTILRNRVQRGGIMASGAGLVKTGENGRGIRSRWYPETLARRIREIAFVGHRISFVEGDGFALIEQHLCDDDCVFFADPPYVKAGRRLYTCWEFDHERLFSLLSRCRGDFLMTYDCTEEIVNLAAKYHLSSRTVAMKNTHHAQKNELLIGRDLSWLKPLSPLDETVDSE